MPATTIERSPARKPAPGRQAKGVSAIKLAKKHETELKTFLDQHPKIKNADDATQARDQMLMTRDVMRQLREEQEIESLPIKAEIEPLKRKLDALKVRYGTARAPLDELNATLRDRVEQYMTRAEQQTTDEVSVRSTEGRGALKLKDHEVLTVEDACAAIKAVGLTDRIR